MRALLPAPLRRRAFALFWVAGVVSDVGTWVQLLTISTLVATSTGKAASTALVVAATFAPQGLCSPIGGVLADRWDRRRMFLAMLSVQTIVTGMLALLIAHGERDPNVLALVVLCQSSAGALGSPAAQAILPDLVPKEELLAAVSLSITSWNAGRVLGPLLAFAAALLGPSWAIGVNAVSFAVLVVAVGMLRRPFRPVPHPRRPIPVELAEGVRALRSKASLRLSWQISFVTHIGLIPFMGMAAIVATKVLHGGQRTTSALSAAQGVGAIIGTLFVPMIVSRYGRSWTLQRSLVLTIGFLVVYAWTRSLVPAMLALAVLGAAISVSFATNGGVSQRDAPREQRGRVLSIANGSNGLVYGASLVAAGRLTDHIGVHWTLTLGAAIALVGFTVVTLTHGRWRTLIDHGDDVAPRARRGGVAVPVSADS